MIGKFPPTLVITGTRAMDLSPAIVTNSRLLKAGVESTLVVELQEARDAYDVTVNFFRKHLR